MRAVARAGLDDEPRAGDRRGEPVLVRAPADRVLAVAGAVAAGQSRGSSTTGRPGGYALHGAGHRSKSFGPKSCRTRWSRTGAVHSRSGEYEVSSW